MLGGEKFGVLDNRFLARSIGLLNPKQPVTVPEDDPVRDVIQLLQKNKTGCVIVIDKDGRVSGIFSERDALLKVTLAEVDLDETPISELMTTDPRTASMTTTIAFALNMMSQGGYRHIPVVDDDKFPVGIVSVKDIVDYVVSTLVENIAEVTG